MTIWLVVAFWLVTSGQGICEIYLHNGETWDISIEVNTNIHVDFLTSGEPTTVNILDGAKLDSTITGYNNSSINVLGGEVNTVSTHNNSTADISGGIVNAVDVFDNSTTAIAGGNVSSLWAWHSSTIDIFDGIVNLNLIPDHNSTVKIYGGWVNRLHASGSSTVTFFGQNFVLGDGLWLEDDRLFGTGMLSGQWVNGMEWTTEIGWNPETSTILLIPEPMTLLLLGFGGLALRRRKR